MNNKQQWLKLIEILNYITSLNGVYSDTLVKLVDELQALIEELE